MFFEKSIIYSQSGVLSHLSRLTFDKIWQR